MLTRNLFAAGLAAIVMTAGTLSYPARAQTQDCRLVSLGEVPLSRAADGHLLLSAELNGEPIEVAIDFERNFSLISQPLAQALGASINSHVAAILTMGEGVHGDIATLGTLHLGQANLKDFQAAVNDSRNAFNGIVLGMNALRFFLPEFDLAHNTLRLFGKDHCPDKVVYWSAQYLKFGYDDKIGWLQIPSQIDGRQIYAALEPDRLRSQISFDTADQLALPHEGTGILEAMEFGGITMHHVPVDVADLRYPRDIVPSIGSHLSQRSLMTPTDLKLGADVLGHFRFMIDFDAKTIYLTVG